MCRCRPTLGIQQAATYDAQGVTAAFNRNVLRRLNSELRADFDIYLFQYLAIWNRRKRRIEMRLRSLGDQLVRVPAHAFQPDSRTGAGPATVGRSLQAVGFTRSAALRRAFRLTSARLAETKGNGPNRSAVSSYAT